MFRIADYKAPEPGMTSCSKVKTNNPYAHDIAELMGMKVEAYFDLGGIRILLSDERYKNIERDVQVGKLPNTRFLSLTELGYDSHGVQIDLACITDDGSSIVWIKRWVTTSITIETNSGVVHVMNQQVVGFVRRRTPLLIIGQEGCRLCGYKNIEEQDAE